jgi:hypothetical protein
MQYNTFSFSFFSFLILFLFGFFFFWGGEGGRANIYRQFNNCYLLLVMPYLRVIVGMSRHIDFLKPNMSMKTI